MMYLYAGVWPAMFSVTNRLVFKALLLSLLSPWGYFINQWNITAAGHNTSPMSFIKNTPNTFTSKTQWANQNTLIYCCCGLIETTKHSSQMTEMYLLSMLDNIWVKGKVWFQGTLSFSEVWTRKRTRRGDANVGHGSLWLDRLWGHETSRQLVIFQEERLVKLF